MPKIAAFKVAWVGGTASVVFVLAVVLAGWSGAGSRTQEEKAASAAPPRAKDDRASTVEGREVMIEMVANDTGRGASRQCVFGGKEWPIEALSPPLSDPRSPNLGPNPIYQTVSEGGFSEVGIQHPAYTVPIEKERGFETSIGPRPDHNIWAACMNIRPVGCHTSGAGVGCLSPSGVLSSYAWLERNAHLHLAVRLDHGSGA